MSYKVHLNYIESWVMKNWYLWTKVLEKTLESPLDCKETKPVNPIGNQSWIFIGRTDAEAEVPILWHLMWRANSLEKTLMLRKIEGRRIRGQPRTRYLDGITDSMDMNLSKLWEMMKDRGSLVCCSLWGLKELDMTERLNNNNKFVPRMYMAWAELHMARLWYGLHTMDSSVGT